MADFASFLKSALSVLGPVGALKSVVQDLASEQSMTGTKSLIADLVAQ